MKFTKVSERLPIYGEPVLLVVNGVVQHITYMLDGDDNVSDWFAPYHFKEYELSRWWHDVESWIYVSDLEEVL